MPAADRPRYTLRMDIRPSDAVVDGTETVDFVPDMPTDHLVFRLWPNGPKLAAAGAHLDAGPVVLDGQPTGSRLDAPTTLVVPLAQTLLAGHHVLASLPWHLRLPGPVNDRVARLGDAVRLGSFYPVLAWEPGVGWDTEPPTALSAETSTTTTSDYDVTVTVPPGVTVLATGATDGGGHWTATAVRDFALSTGHFRTAAAIAHAPQPVQVTVGVDDAVSESPGPYLEKAVRVIEAHSERFGPYPWSTYTIAMTPALHGGIEYPSFAMQGAGTIGRTTSHELGHQWFYGLVGDDEARDPWLDEGLATYAEGRYEGTLATMQSTLVPLGARGHAGEPMTYWEPRGWQYYVGVYIQTAGALASLGPPDLVDCALRRYAAIDAYRIARPRDLFASLATVFPDAVARLAPFGLHP